MSTIAERGYAKPDVLVDTQWVADHLKDPNVRIVESNEDQLLYPSGHIPGAVQVDWARDLNDQVRRDYVDKANFEALMSRIGARRDTTVVFYGDKNNWWATYAFWVFQLFGHTNAKVMDGGRLKWEKEGREMTREVPSYPATKYEAPVRDDTKIRAFKDEVLKHSAAGKPLIDVRSPEEFRGERTHMPDYPQEGVLRGGHIPGRQERAVGEGGESRRRHFQECRRAEGHLRTGRGPEVGRRCGHLLPDRRALQPHLVRPDLPPRLPQREELRRQLDRVRQLRRGAGGEVSQHGNRRSLRGAQPLAQSKPKSGGKTTTTIAAQAA